MGKNEGSNAVSNARSAIVVFSILMFVIGIILTIVGISGESHYGFHEISWTPIYIGLLCIFSGVSLLILNAVLKGVEQIVKASEMYMDGMSAKESKEAEGKTIRLPLETAHKTPTHI